MLESHQNPLSPLVLLLKFVLCTDRRFCAVHLQIIASTDVRSLGGEAKSALSAIVDIYVDKIRQDDSYSADEEVGFVCLGLGIIVRASVMSVIIVRTRINLVDYGNIHTLALIHRLLVL